MKLHEYQSKKLLAFVGIPIPKGKVISKAELINHFFDDFSGSVLLKAQVLSGGRGKTGGIRLAKTRIEAEKIASSLFASNMFRNPINKILMEELVDFEEGYLVGIYINQKKGVIELRGSSSIKLWKNNKNLPEFLPELISVEIDPFIGVQDFIIRELAVSIGLNRQFWGEFVDIIKKMWEIFKKYDATKIEINPLAITKDQKFVSLGVKIDIDDNALYRQSEIEDMFDYSAIDKQENDAKKLGLSYVKLDGEIGCISNGQGLTFATIDMIEQYGGQLSGYINLGSCASALMVAEGLRVFNEDPRTKIVLINIFGGLTSCEQISEGIISQMQLSSFVKPVIVRFAGNHMEVGLKRLEETGIQTA
ncbi:MAG: succinate--CoA ligase subunit beta, partial [Pelolinea sp.]|nr:succinate--CoA ligase subunit beta [Pelolinea sp.]